MFPNLTVYISEADIHRLDPGSLVFGNYHIDGQGDECLCIVGKNEDSRVDSRFLVALDSRQGNIKNQGLLPPSGLKDYPLVAIEPTQWEIEISISPANMTAIHPGEMSDIGPGRLYLSGQGKFLTFFNKNSQLLGLDLYHFIQAEIPPFPGYKMTDWGINLIRGDGSRVKALQSDPSRKV